MPGDGRTLSITLAVRVADTELRACLSDPAGFERAVRMLEGPSRFFAAGPLEPIGGIRPMAGLLNRTRRYLDADGAPRVLGLHAVGDSHTCTNPLYGRGCSLALVQSLRLADAIAAHGDDAVARAEAYEAACRREIEPWYHSSVEMDVAGSDPGTDGDGEERPPNPMARVFVAAETDPVIGRALTSMMNLLVTPAELANDPMFSARVAAIFADPDAYPLPARAGPSPRRAARRVGLTSQDRRSTCVRPASAARRRGRPLVRLPFLAPQQPGGRAQQHDHRRARRSPRVGRGTRRRYRCRRPPSPTARRSP